MLTGIRPEVLTLQFFVGGHAGAYCDAESLKVPLTLGGGVLLAPQIQQAGTQGPQGRLDAPSVTSMDAVVPAAKVTGKLSLLGARSYELWGVRQWDALAKRMLAIAGLDGGLAPAGLAILDIAVNHTVVEDADAWCAAVVASTGFDAADTDLNVLGRLAPTFTGSATDLVGAARAIAAPAAR